MSQVFDEFVCAAVHDHRPWFRLPGFVDTDIRFAHAYACDSYGGRLSPEWLDRCTFPSERGSPDPISARAATEFCNGRIATGTDW